MPIELLRFDAHVLNLRARMPFRYGITSMIVTPHLFLRCELAVDGQRATGVSADNLAPKWFTKDPHTTFEQDLADMFRVIRAAATHAMSVRTGTTVYDLWSATYDRQSAWAKAEGFPPLLSGFGTSLVERAIIEAYCRATRVNFGDALRRDLLGFDLGRLHREKLGRTGGWVESVRPRDLLPAAALRTVASRHTSGMADYLTDADIPPAERIDDGLPQSLEACIKAYGLKRFKVKLGGELVKDRERLRRAAELIESSVGTDYRITLDFNELFTELEPFTHLWEQLSREPSLEGFLSKLIFIEQPLHRSVALGEPVKQAMRAWANRPPIIIDESDSSIGTLLEALDGGYAGTSHKNCKGVFKSVANAMVLEHGRRTDPGRPYLLSSEDLTNVAPSSLQQDVAVAASLGIEMVERNGHHYFKGLSMLPVELQQSLLAAHGDLYRQHPRGFPTLDIRDGRLAIGSVVDAPFGVGVEYDPGLFTPIDQWEYSSIANG